MDDYDDDYDDYLAERELARLEEAEYWLNKPQRDGRAPADFEYDPLSKKGFE